MREEIEKICDMVLRRITPKKEEREKIEALAKKLEEKLASTCEFFDVKAKVRLEGSVAKDTWLSEEPDIDIFMRVPSSIPRKSLGEVCLKVARKATEGAEQIERFAEHPYLEAIIEGIRVNIVPCYDVKRGEWLSATDRTPYHTDYVKKHLTVKMRDEVRLLKRFMKGIGVYGAEIKIGGFSGYLCELLILHYKTFLNVIKAFAETKQRIVIDIENYYKGRREELALLFPEPIVMVDPVDKGRNVASAVQPLRLYTLIAASRSFLKNPNLSFFYPLEKHALTLKELKEEFKKRGSAIILLAFKKVDAVPDILWGQLYKSQRSLSKLLQLNDFKVLRQASWSDERTLNAFIFELEQKELPPIKKHLGPPLEKVEECEKFLKKHLGKSETLCGPYIEDGRWVVEIRRKYTNAVSLLEEKLKDGGRNAGIAEEISKKIREGLKIFVNDQVAEIYEKNMDFAVFFTEFLAGKPQWLETA
ncbi:MAG: CCA tRNA nucleotidyltransferase [Candidatus Bathyarchaeia archaeon]|nr:MAG: CCA tRNA nucleotidyltransferase [Candidatus Bathyarchaeota archaeon]